jgi:hypothetical protein
VRGTSVHELIKSRLQGTSPDRLQGTNCATLASIRMNIPGEDFRREDGLHGSATDWRLQVC